MEIGAMPGFTLYIDWLKIGKAGAPEKLTVYEIHQQNSVNGQGLNLSQSLRQFKIPLLNYHFKFLLAFFGNFF
jgi:hypothetical protein